MNKQRLRLWQERLAKNGAAFELEFSKMDEREKIYRGTRSIRAVNPEDDIRDTPHLRNIAAEVIEAQVDSGIPKPKVTPKRKEDEWRAKLIEDMLLCELDRLEFERINDMLSRTVPIQGGAGYLVEWDSSKRTHTTVGELAVSGLHPKRIVPQDGVFGTAEDMDYIILKRPQTKGNIKRLYGVDVSDEHENEPDIRGLLEHSADDMVTQYTAYYKNDDGSIGLYSWVNDTELCDYDNYQARRVKKCKKCGAVITGLEEHIPPTLDGTYPLEDENNETLPSKPNSIEFGFNKMRGDATSCPYCESTSFEMVSDDYEELTSDIERSDGTVIPGSVTEYDEFGLPYSVPVKIPYYKPDKFPVVLIKNVSVYGKLHGDSDIDKVSDAQNTTNRIWRKVLEKITSGGSYMTLPVDAAIETGPGEIKIIRLDNPADKAIIGTHDMEGNVSQDMNTIMQVYEESRQAIGITDSFQGRVDRTATSGKAKEFAAVQSAGRLESKRVMKEAAFSELFELMFKFKLAYTDEPRPVMSKDVHGNTIYSEFNRYDFLEVDAAGEYYWNDDFMFSCDSTEPLAKNREAMWQETRLNFQSGAFGDPTQTKTRILFWTKMEDLHYPGAAETKAYLEEELEAEKNAIMQQQMMMQAQMQAQAEEQARAEAQAEAIHRAQHSPPPFNKGGLAGNVVERAKADAMRDVMGGIHR